MRSLLAFLLIFSFAGIFLVSCSNTSHRCNSGGRNACQDRFRSRIDKLDATQQAKLIAGDGEEDDLFGFSVSIDGDTIVVGALNDKYSGYPSGSAYIFNRTDSRWVQTARLVPDDLEPYDKFGHSVSISGDTMLAGSATDLNYGKISGSAYVFQRSGQSWLQQAKLQPTTWEDWDWFGRSVSLSGDTAVIGVPEDDFGDLGSNFGSAYAFVRVGGSWDMSQKLTARNGVSHDRFGMSVSVSGDIVVVGAPEDDGIGNAAGSAYVYVRSGSNWIEEARIKPNEVEDDDHFGYSVSVSGISDQLTN